MKLSILKFIMALLYKYKKLIGQEIKYSIIKIKKSYLSSKCINCTKHIIMFGPFLKKHIFCLPGPLYWGGAKDV